MIITEFTTNVDSHQPFLLLDIIFFLYIIMMVYWIWLHAHPCYSSLFDLLGA